MPPCLLVWFVVRSKQRPLVCAFAYSLLLSPPSTPNTLHPAVSHSVTYFYVYKADICRLIQSHPTSRPRLTDAPDHHRPPISRVSYTATVGSKTDYSGRGIGGWNWWLELVVAGVLGEFRDDLVVCVDTEATQGLFSRVLRNRSRVYSIRRPSVIKLEHSTSRVFHTATVVLQLGPLTLPVSHTATVVLKTWTSPTDLACIIYGDCRSSSLNPRPRLYYIRRLSSSRLGTRILLTV